MKCSDSSAPTAGALREIYGPTGRKTIVCVDKPWSRNTTRVVAWSQVGDYQVELLQPDVSRGRTGVLQRGLRAANRRGHAVNPLHFRLFSRRRRGRHKSGAVEQYDISRPREDCIGNPCTERSYPPSRHTVHGRGWPLSRREAIRPLAEGEQAGGQPLHRYLYDVAPDLARAFPTIEDGLDPDHVRRLDGEVRRLQIRLVLANEDHAPKPGVG